nr:CNT_HP1_G0035410.mRNA.1.CDS.1 [Saccharomyces cerevisiae]
MRSLNTLLLSLFVALSSGAPLLKFVKKRILLCHQSKFLVPAVLSLPRVRQVQQRRVSVGLTVNDLIEAVPSLAEKANLDYLQVSNVGSESLKLYASDPIVSRYLRGTSL